MASQIGIQAGPLTSVRQYTDDVKVRDTLLKFYTARSMGPPDATNQEKLDTIVNWIVARIVEDARRYELDRRRDALADEVAGEIGLT
jgi:hypothetical protein